MHSLLNIYTLHEWTCSLPFILNVFFCKISDLHILQRSYDALQKEFEVEAYKGITLVFKRLGDISIRFEGYNAKFPDNYEYI